MLRGSECRFLQAPVTPDGGPAGGQAPRPPAAALDPEALQRLRELDPSGSSKLMERVVKAFDGSVARLLPQLRQAQAVGDAAGIRQVAHTLKSSSASIGAVKLSQLCAEMEALAREGRTDGMPERIAALATETAAVLEALKHTLDSSR